MSASAASAPSAPVPQTRRYAVGVALVALLGMVMLGGYVLWSRDALARALAESRDERVRHVAFAYREKLARAIGVRDATSPQVWAALDPTLEEAFESLPDLKGIVIRLPGGSIGAVIGPSDLRRVPFLAPPGAPEMAIRVDSESGDRAAVTVAFAVPVDRLPAAQANVHLDLPGPGALGPSIGVLFRSGTVLVGVLIYLLAALAFFIARQGTRAANREREKAVRLAAIGDVAGAIAHELRNPLNAISLSFQVLGEALKDGGGGHAIRADDLGRARGEVGKISKVVDNFVSFARLSDMTLSEFDVADVAREAMGRLSERCAQAQVRPAVTASGGTVMSGDRDKIGQALATTLHAALDAVASRPGTLDVDVAGSAREVVVRIRCRGARVDPRRISNFTAARRAWDEPVGLGLTIARTWIDLHGGAVGGGGTSDDKVEVEIRLPKRVA